MIDNRPTVIICESCERVCDITEARCIICDGELTNFIKQTNEEDRPSDKRVSKMEDSDNQGSGAEQFQGDSEEG